ncbi:peptidylprolyl isomerase [Dongshaea marina]|uniref:peptidylprolyl isomerase n=1 Tax=Dongshaea marina TaxID=2047966 RepID=UPI000D3EA5D5|nr:peptidylprolyl isomerase [Dongshaea marina]
MLEKLSEGTNSIFVKIILSLIIISFALAGVGSYMNRPADTDAAKVNGDTISSQALERAYQNERSNLQQQMGSEFSKLAGNPQYLKQLRENVLQNMINETLLNQTVSDMGLRVSDAQVKALIRSMPAFQKDGQFDNERYRLLLARSNQTPDQFAASMIHDLSRQQFINGMVQDDFVLPDEAKSLETLLRQTRDIRYLMIPHKPFLKEVKLTDADVKAYYDANHQRFMRPEEVKVNYLLLNAKDLASTIKVATTDAKQYYEQHKSQYVRPEKIHVAHILVKFGKDPKAAEQKAETILKELKQGADFATLAKKDSQDIFSAKKGGDLSWFGKGVMDPAFEKAAFALNKPGELSGVVKSQFGYHIIKLLGVRPKQTLPFAEVKADVEQTLKLNKAKDKFYDTQQKLADLTFENPDSLDYAAEQVGLKVQKTGYFSRGDAPAPLNSDKALKAAFSESLRQDNTNSDALQISDDQVLVLHIVGYKEQAVKPYSEVKDLAKSQLTDQKAAAKATEVANQLLVKLQSGKSIAAELKQHGWELKTANNVARFDNKLPANLVQTLFTMPHPSDKHRSIQVISLPGGDEALVELLKVTPGKNEPQLAAVMTQQILKMRQGADYQALIKTLRKNAEISYPDKAASDSESSQ